jgi:hypothetical protein
MAKDGFSRNHPQNEYAISPLGAALVEAMPDEARKRRIKQRFKKNKECPTSAIFDKEAVESFYEELGENIKGVHVTVKANA